MPGGRPPQPGTQEEKAAARRERIRQYVQAHRDRKRLLQKQAQAAGRLQDGPQRLGSPTYLTDVARLSQKASIDLSFGLLPAVVHDFDMVTGTRFPWMLTIKQSQPADRIVDLAVLAGGARTIARVRGDETMAEFSRVAYQQALHALWPRLGSADPQYALLMTTVPLALMMFESADGCRRLPNSPWAAHASGCARLMESAGPEAYQSLIGVTILRGTRWVAHTIAMMERKRCFLEDEAWQRIPFKDLPKSPEDILWDILVRSARYLELADILDTELRDSLDSYYTTATLLLEGIGRSQNSLNAWFRNLAALQTDGQVYHRLPVGTWFQKDLPGVFDTSFHYRTFMEADWTLMHWNSLLGQHSLARITQTKLATAGHTALAQRFAALAGSRDASERIARNICQSLEYCIGPDPEIIMGVVSTCHRPLQSALVYFSTDRERYTREIEWCDAVSDIVASRGPHVKGYLKDGVSALLSGQQAKKEE